MLIIAAPKNCIIGSINKEKIDLGKTIVIGGGNVAQDAARVANKMGAKTTIVYRRNEEKMPASISEINDAKKEGVEFLFNTKVLKANIDASGRIKSVECSKTITQGDKIEDVENSIFNI